MKFCLAPCPPWQQVMSALGPRTPSRVREFLTTVQGKHQNLTRSASGLGSQRSLTHGPAGGHHEERQVRELGKHQTTGGGRTEISAYSPCLTRPASRHVKADSGGVRTERSSHGWRGAGWPRLRGPSTHCADDISAGPGDGLSFCVFLHTGDRRAPAGQPMLTTPSCLTVGSGPGPALTSAWPESQSFLRSMPTSRRRTASL